MTPNEHEPERRVASIRAKNYRPFGRLVLRLSVGGPASLTIEAIHQHMVEADTVTIGHGLHSNKSVVLEKALGKLCRIGAQQACRSAPAAAALLRSLDRCLVNAGHYGKPV